MTHSASTGFEQMGETHRSQRSGALNLGVLQGATKGMFSGDWDVSETGNVDMQISSGMGGLASFSNRGTDPL